MNVGTQHALMIALLAGTPLPAAAASAQVPCTGQKAFPTPRPEASCLTISPQVYASPDGALRAYVFPSDVDLYATPDMESRVVVRTRDGKLLTSRDYSSPRGTNGYYVVNAKWSPDSQYFVFSLSSSGGHSPWSFPTWVYGRQRNIFASFSDMIGNNPTVSSDFLFVGPHTITAVTWDKPGSDKTVSVAVDLAPAMAQAQAADQ